MAGATHAATPRHPQIDQRKQCAKLCRVLAQFSVAHLYVLELTFDNPETGVFLDLAERLLHRQELGFFFVGRGSEARQLASNAAARGLDNVLLKDKIHPDEIPSLYAQCHAGLVALDPRHKTHNIPGKFLTYMQSGLPVLASVNAGNDLANLIRTEQVGQVSETNQIEELLLLTEKLLLQLNQDPDLPNRCRRLFQREYSVTHTVQKIVAALSA